jgi:hypothetical protein
MWIAWPAFLAAAMMEMLVFAFVDPLELHWLGDLGWSRQAIYTLAFFSFWAVTLFSSLMTTMLGRLASDLNGGIVSEPDPELALQGLGRDGACP